MRSVHSHNNLKRYLNKYMSSDLHQWKKANDKLKKHELLIQNMCLIQTFTAICNEILLSF